MTTPQPERWFGIDDVKVLNFRKIIDDRGALVPIEENADVPFPIVRLFTVAPSRAGEDRGAHAHYLCRQVFICVHGRCTVVCDDGRERREFVLSEPGVGLFVPETLWAEQRYETADTVVIVLTDRRYEPEDYIRDAAEFRRFRGVAPA